MICPYSIIDHRLIVLDLAIVLDRYESFWLEYDVEVVVVVRMMTRTRTRTRRHAND